ncbi:hypothetical protein MPTK1_4g09830 [Marchantia polymorpha subsp. ruderalis]
MVMYGHILASGHSHIPKPPAGLRRSFRMREGGHIHGRGHRCQSGCTDPGFCWPVDNSNRLIQLVQGHLISRLISANSVELANRIGRHRRCNAMAEIGGGPEVFRWHVERVKSSVAGQRIDVPDDEYDDLCGQGNDSLHRKRNFGDVGVRSGQRHSNGHHELLSCRARHSRDPSEIHIPPYGDHLDEHCTTSSTQ